MRLGIGHGLVTVSLVILAGCTNPNDVGQRAAVGALAGATLGASIGAAFAVNPGAGALIGTVGGGAAGAIAGVVTAEPAPSYGPIPVRDTTAAPEFYDTWPPGYHSLPPGHETPPPPARAG